MWSVVPTPRPTLTFALSSTSRPARGWPTRCVQQLPNAVEVVLAPRGDAEVSPASDPNRLGRTPRDLVAEYLSEHDAHDERVVALFDELVDELTGDVSGAPR